MCQAHLSTLIALNNEEVFFAAATNGGERNLEGFQLLIGWVRVYLCGSGASPCFLEMNFVTPIQKLNQCNYKSFDSFSCISCPFFPLGGCFIVYAHGRKSIYS